MKYIPIILLVLSQFSRGNAQTIQSKIILKTDAWQDTIVFLAGYFGNNLTVIDTIKIDHKGKGVAENTYHVGEYVVVFPDRSQYPLLINEKTLNLTFTKGQMEYYHSKENNFYINFLEIENAIELRRKKLRLEKVENRNEMQMNLEKLELQRTIFLSINEKKITKMLAGKIIKATCLPNDLEYFYDYPEAAKWRKKEYFEHIDFSDPIWLYTKIFHEKVRFYVNHVTENNPDSVINTLALLFESAKESYPTYQFLVDYWLSNYQRSKKPENEIIFKYLVETYVLAGQTPWIDEYKTARFETQLQFLKNQLLGETPPTFKLYDQKDNLVDYSLYRKNYQMLLFWDPSCAHCQVDVPKYYAVYKEFKNQGFSAISIYKELDREAWLEFIEINNLNWTNLADFKNQGNITTEIFITETPTVLLLNKEGTIIAKRFTDIELKKILKELYKNELKN